VINTEIERSIDPVDGEDPDKPSAKEFGASHGSPVPAKGRKNHDKAANNEEYVYTGGAKSEPVTIGGVMDGGPTVCGQILDMTYDNEKGGDKTEELDGVKYLDCWTGTYRGLGDVDSRSEREVGNIRSLYAHMSPL
jgi:hypothetical protein